MACCDQAVVRGAERGGAVVHRGGLTLPHLRLRVVLRGLGCLFWGCKHSLINHALRWVPRRMGAWPLECLHARMHLCTQAGVCACARPVCLHPCMHVLWHRAAAGGVVPAPLDEPVPTSLFRPHLSPPDSTVPTFPHLAHTAPPVPP
eukprot:308094-Chlamydomonas_euryale.AAC.2